MALEKRIADCQKKNDDFLEKELGAEKRYRFVETIPAPPKSTVWIVHDALHNRECVVKYPSKEEFLDAKRREILKKCADIFKKSENPNIIRIYELVNDRYMVMERAEGSLRNLMSNSDSVLDVPDAIDGIAQICNGLADIHNAGCVHCDIKPENVLYNAEGVLKVSDLGLVTEAGHSTQGSFGAICYCAPEQRPTKEEKASGKEPVAFTSSDTYSTGVMLFEMLTGRALFSGNDDEEIRRQKKNIEKIKQKVNSAKRIPSNFEVEPGKKINLKEIILNCLVYDHEKRIYSTANELLAAFGGTTVNPADTVKDMAKHIFMYVTNTETYDVAGKDIVQKIIADRRKIEERVLRGKLQNDSRVADELAKIDYEISNKRGTDYAKFHALARTDLPSPSPELDAWLAIPENAAKRDAYYALILEWDITTDRFEKKWNSENIKPTERKRLIADGKDWLNGVLAGIRGKYAQ